MKKTLFRWIILAAILVSCTMPEPNVAPASSGGVRAWFDVPRDGEEYTFGETVPIRWHASAPEGIQLVALRINGEQYGVMVDFDHTAPLVTAAHDWLPPASGQYLIEITATSNAGAISRPSANIITVLGATATATASATPVETPTLNPSVTPTVTPTPTSTATNIPGVTIQFWAEPASIQAGACTTIRWHVENAQKVVFGGAQQSFDGSYQDCLCSSQHYTLTTTLLNGAEEKRTVDITVSGTCAVSPPIVTTAPPPPPPPVDDDGPPKPALIKPPKDASFPCHTEAITLRWNEPSDPSGIASYQVDLHTGILFNMTLVNSWKKVNGTSLTLTSPDISCGKIYFWRVAARDGAGNLGDFSASYFKIEEDFD